MERIRRQLKDDQLAIGNALNRGDYELVKYKLDQMKELCEILQQPNIEELYAECVTTTKKLMSQRVENAVTSLNQNIKKHVPIFLEEIEKYQKLIEDMRTPEELTKPMQGQNLCMQDYYWKTSVLR